MCKMNFLVLINFFFLLGLNHAQFGSSETVHNRVTRNAFRNMAEQYIPVLEKIIIDNCKANGQHEAAEKLEPTFQKMKICLGKKKLLVTPRDEFLAFLDECNAEAVKQSKNCLAETQGYYPELLNEYAKSLTKFLYDDYNDIHADLVTCYSKLNNANVLSKYQQCLREVSIRTHESREIPNTKAAFCQTFIPTAYCFTNMVKENCDRTKGLTKFREDYVKVHKDICEEGKAA